jgi:hypothetical protein
MSIENAAVSDGTIEAGGPNQGIKEPQYPGKPPTAEGQPPVGEAAHIEGQHTPTAHGEHPAGHANENMPPHPVQPPFTPPEPAATAPHHKTPDGGGVHTAPHATHPAAAETATLALAAAHASANHVPVDEARLKRVEEALAKEIGPGVKPYFIKAGLQVSFDAQPEKTGGMQLSLTFRAPEDKSGLLRYEASELHDEVLKILHRDPVLAGLLGGEHKTTMQLVENEPNASPMRSCFISRM